MEAGYKRILFAEAGNMLYFKTKEELINFAKEVFLQNLNLLNFFFGFNDLNHFKARLELGRRQFLLL